MKIQKLYLTLCGVLLAAQMASAQQTMIVVDNDGQAKAVNVSTVDYATFHANDKWFTISNDGIKGVSSDLIVATCTVGLSAESNVKSLSTTPEIGVCYSKDKNIPTIDDDCQTFGSELKSHTFALGWLMPGTTYYFRIYMKLANDVFYGDVVSAKTLDTKPLGNGKTVNGHKFIDLGLPSGLLWAETNVGAEEATDIGCHFAWGETDMSEKSTYDWNNYKYGTQLDLTKYNVTDGKTVLDKEDEAAYVNWGAPCRMPTNDELLELYDTCNCIWSWTSMFVSGRMISGYRVTSIKNWNSIFLPATGLCTFEGNLDAYSCGYYWSNTISWILKEWACCLDFSSVSVLPNFGSREFGRAVRPVTEP